jgi:hypothetical protein
VLLSFKNSTLGLCDPVALAPAQKSRINSVLSDAIGKRKSYARAVSRFEKARDEHRSLAKVVVDDTQTDAVTTKDAEVVDHCDLLQAHIVLLNQRRRYEKVRILQDYLDLLGQKPASDIHFLDLHKMVQALGEPPQLPTEVLERTEDGASTPHTDAAANLVGQLERAVLRAKNLLDCEKAFATELEAQKTLSADQINKGFMSPEKHSKLEAIRRTRDDLIVWIEEELPKGNNGQQDNYAEGKSMFEPNPHQTLEKQICSIKVQYDRYVKSRQLLLDTLLVMNEPTVSRTGTGVKPLQSSVRADNARLSCSRSIQDLSLLKEQLLPMSNQQKSFIQQKSHIATSLAKQQRATLATLSRLGEESHLLLSFPLIARQPQFQNAAALLSSRAFKNETRPASATVVSTGENEALEKACAWAFASEAAAEATRDYVLKNVKNGEKAMMESRKTMAELRTLLGDSETREGSSTAKIMSNESRDWPGDIWTADLDHLDQAVGSRRQGARPRFESTEVERHGSRTGGTAGPWQGLNGRFGVIGDSL